MNPFPTFSITLAALTTIAAAQDLVPKAPPQTVPIVLKNATLHTIDGGVILNGTLWFANSTIRGVLASGAEPRMPNDQQPVVLDMTGKHVFPGLISARTTLGLVELGMVRQTVDTDEVGEQTPEAAALTAINPDSAAIPVARSNGVLIAAVFPSGGQMPGRASVVQLDGWTNADMNVRADAGPIVAWPTQATFGGRGRRGPSDEGASPDDDKQSPPWKKTRERIDATFTAARAWLDARLADPSVPLDVRHEALVPALRGEAPVFLMADEQEQIESAVLWATGRNLKAVVVGGRDAALCASLLKERRVPVIVDGVHRLPRRDDSPYDEAFTLPARLFEAGVKFCIAGGSDFSNDRNVPYHAATAAAFGLGRPRALQAITLDAAEILGVADRVGSLTVGKDATLFVADGHPFEMKTKIEMAFVKGRQVDLRNKQTELAAKYRERYRQLRTK